MTLVAELTETGGVVRASPLASGYLCCVIGGLMQSAIMVPRRFRLAKAFAFARTIGPIQGTAQATERFSREPWVSCNSRFCVDKVDEVGEGEYHSSCNSHFIYCSTPSVLERKWKLGDHALEIVMVEYRQEG